MWKKVLGTQFTYKGKYLWRNLHQKGTSGRDLQSSNTDMMLIRERERGNRRPDQRVSLPIREVDFSSTAKAFSRTMAFLWRHLQIIRKPLVPRLAVASIGKKSALFWFVIAYNMIDSLILSVTTVSQRMSDFDVRQSGGYLLIVYILYNSLL